MNQLMNQAFRNRERGRSSERVFSMCRREQWPMDGSIKRIQGTSN